MPVRFNLASLVNLAFAVGLGFCFPISARGQTGNLPVAAGFFTRSWQTDDGLPANAVNGIVQDHQGFIWLATIEGLVRFDGANFKPFTSPLIAEIAARNIRSLALEDDSTLLMLPAVGGVVRLRDGHFSIHPIGEGLTGQLSTLFVEPGGAVWLGMSGGEVRRWKDGKHLDFGPADGLNSRAKATFAADTRGQVWIGSGGYLCCYRDGRLSRINDIGSADFVAVAPSRSGGIWIWKDTQLLKMETARLAVISTNLPWTSLGGIVREMLEDSTGALWVGTDAHGLFRFADGKFTRVETSQNQISSIIEDQEGSIWAATTGGGINRLRPKPFRLYDAKSGLPEDVSDSVCVDDQGDVWLANRRSGVVQIRHGEVNALRLQSGARRLGAYAVCPDNRGGLWVSESALGLYRFQRDPPNQIEWLNLGEVHALFKRRNGDLWVGAEANVLGHFPQGQTNQFLPVPGFPGRSTRCIAEDSAGRIWVGVESGELFELAEGHLTVFGVAAGLPKAPLRALYADADGSLWIGTIGGGLVLRRNGHFTRISAANGLPDDEVSEILEDDSGRLWCGSRAGIFHVAKSDLLAFADGRSSKVNGVTFGRSEGLSGISCLGTCQPAAWKAKTGQLWFTTQQGALALDASALKPNRRAPPVFIDELLVNDQPFAQPLRATGVLGIPPICRKLEFRFAALSFAAPEKVHLRYRLDPIDSQWLELVGQRAAIYAGLPPGHYRMRVTACNNDGVWNETGATLAFEVLPAWWQSWGFKAAELFFFTATLALGVRYWSRRRLKLKLERLEHQQAMGRERTRIARDLHDDLGASLTQVGLMVEELKEAPRLTDELKNKSAALSSRVRHPGAGPGCGGLDGQPEE